MEPTALPDDALPKPTPHEQAAMREFSLAMDRHRQAVSDESRARMENIPFVAALIKNVAPEQLAAQEQRNVVLQRQALLENNWRPYVTDLRTQAAGYARAGIPFPAWLPILTIADDIIQRKLMTEHDKSPEKTALAVEGKTIFFSTAIGILGQAYLDAKEQLIGRQQEAIRELSTPILQLRQGLLLLPVVGLVDTQRARHLTEQLLIAIRDRRARVVVMDITGVPVVDSKVANHFVQACEAARLMGAHVILTGISAEIAQALVTIGAELHGARTLGDLQSGIEEANVLQGMELVKTAPGAPARG